MKKLLFLLTLGAPTLKLLGQDVLDKPTKQKSNYIYIGPETFVFNLNTHVKDVRIKGNPVFIGLRARYEYLKANTVYAGIDLLSSISPGSLQADQCFFHFPKNYSATGCGNFELRLGYTTNTQKSGLVSPFLGFGAYSFANCGNYFHFQETMLYYAFGMRSQFNINQNFSIGLNWKILHTFDTEREFAYKACNFITLKDHSNMWGGEFGLPMTWQIGTRKRWNVQLEPYFLKLDFSETQNIYGARALFGYRF